MSDRNNPTRPLKPTLASTRVARTPLTPRIAGNNATPSTRSTASKAASSVRSEPPRVTPRVKQQETSSPVKDAFAIANVTPRSSARKSRVDSSQSTPTQSDDTPSVARPRSTIATSTVNGERNGTVGGLGIARAARPRSLASDVGSNRGQSPPLIRSPGRFDLAQTTTDETIDGRFFHASDAPKQEPVLIKPKPEPKKPAAFFYADGQQEEKKASFSPSPVSPVLSAVSEKRSSGPWIRNDAASNPSRSPPMLSPALSTLSNTSPFFAAATGQQKPRSPSPSKENIHLSYRKGASQIFGTRPPPRSEATPPIPEDKRSSIPGPLNTARTPHRKSPSLSSLDSSASQQSRRRRSATTLEVNAPSPSPLTQIAKAPTNPPADRSPDPTPLSPTKAPSSFSDLAADARRERKVLDLEISNSSLLAINSSLEREIRRQKTELKRFRRLSRAGRFSLNPGERTARLSEGLSAVGEEDVEEGDQDYGAFGPPSGFTDVYDDFSDDDDEDGSESVTSGGGGGELLSPGRRESRESARLAKDEKRLRVDLEKHKELLVQSQMMNQSLKRCLYSTEDMIKEGKRALEYYVRVSDVKLGGRVLLAGDEEREEVIEVEDALEHAGDLDAVTGADGDGGNEAEDFLKVWQGVGQRVAFEGSDRDSGIEVDKPPLLAMASTQAVLGVGDNNLRPLDFRRSLSELGQER